MAYSGIFRPKHPEKYKGDPDKIVWRSLWERAVMVKLDDWSQVISWASEEFSIPYMSPVDNKPHRYFPDMLVEFKTNDGSIKRVILEIKPKKYCTPPKIPKRKTRRYFGECVEYSKNQAKWSAARAFAAEQGMAFQIVTEDDIFPKTIKKVAK